jgi:hypothetical protein
MTQLTIKKHIGALLSALTMLLVLDASAEQVVMLDTGSTPNVSITAKHPFLVEFAVGKVYRIDGRNGIDWTVDEETGVMKDLGKVVVEPITDKPFSLIVTRDDGRSFQLQLNPIKTGGSEHLVLKSALASDSDTVLEDARLMNNLVNAKSRDKTIRMMVEAMAKDVKAKGFSQTKTEQVVSLWQEANVVETSIWKGMGIKGKVWMLTNVSGQEMTLDEREFYFDQVAAVAIVKPVLQPGESTKVLMVMETAKK